jgi:hypothetical protein
MGLERGNPSLHECEARINGYVAGMLRVDAAEAAALQAGCLRSSRARDATETLVDIGEGGGESAWRY